MASTSLYHPAGKLRKPLIACRSLQVAFSALSCVNNAYLLFFFAHFHKVFSARSQYGTSATPFIAAMVAIFAVSLVLGVASLASSITFLTYTLSPKARHSSCGGGCTPCARYSCDFGCDCALAALWGLALVLGVLGSARSSVGAAIVGVAFCGALFVLYVATAVMSSKVRRAVMAGPLSTAFQVEGPSQRDLEAGMVARSAVTTVAPTPVVGLVAAGLYAPGADAGGAQPPACRPAIGVPVHKV